MKRTKKLLVLAIALIMTLGMATTTAFAWLTLNDTVSTGQVELEAKTDVEGLMISTAHGTGYKYVLTADNINKANTHLASARLSDLSIVESGNDSEKKYEMRKMSGTAIDNEATGLGAKNKEYVEFPLYFRYENNSESTVDYNIVLPKNGVTVVAETSDTYNTLAWGSEGVELTQYVSSLEELNEMLKASKIVYANGDFSSDTLEIDTSNTDKTYTQFKLVSDTDFSAADITIEEGRPIPANAAYCARVAFIANSYNLDDDLADSKYTYDDTAIKGTTTAINAKPVAIIDPLSDKGYKTGNIAWDAYKYVWSSTEDMPITYSGTDDNVTKVTASTEPTEPTESIELLTLTNVTGTNFYYGSVVVRIWLEGTDPDCFNSILGDKLAFSLKFTVEQAKPTN